MSLGQFTYVHTLQTLWPLANFEFNLIALLKPLISFLHDGAIVDKNIGAIVLPDKAKPLRIAERFDLASNPRHALSPPSC